MVPRERGYYFYKYLKKTRIYDYSKSKGNLGIKVLRKVDHDQTHFLLITFWDSVDSIHRFTGKKYSEARTYPADECYLLETESVNHYDLAYTTVFDSGSLCQVDG